MTSQTPETIIYEGIKYNINAYVLEQIRPKIEFHPIGSFCWRGYRGTYEIKNDKLYLVDLMGWRNDPNSRHIVPQIRFNEEAEFYMGEREEFDFQELALQDVFPAVSTDGVFADWFTGELSIPWGESDEKEKHINYLVFSFIDGVVQSKSVKSYEKAFKFFNRNELIKKFQRSTNEDS